MSTQLQAHREYLLSGTSVSMQVGLVHCPWEQSRADTSSLCLSPHSHTQATDSVSHLGHTPQALQHQQTCSSPGGAAKCGPIF